MLWNSLKTMASRHRHTCRQCSITCYDKRESLCVCVCVCVPLEDKSNKNCNEDLMVGIWVCWGGGGGGGGEKKQ